MANIAQVGKQTIEKMQVRIDHLDQLLSLAGEVIITSANITDLERRIQQAIRGQETLCGDTVNVVKACNEATQRISQDLHNLVMAIRLIEIDKTMRLFRRPIRDLSRSLGRDVNLVFEGSETMIDKALAERLVDPLLHLLRNAVDHGIEPPLERQQAGKPPQGTIKLSAVDNEDSTLITISDDGRGISPEEIAQKTEQLGIPNHGNQLLDLICTPGFSTATEVTSTSGRGVGLDLVKTVTNEFNGSIELKNELGQGCSFSLTIPKLKAVNILDALTLRAGENLFAMPIDRIVASLGIKVSQIHSALDRGRYFLYQGSVIVLHDLQELLGKPPLELDSANIPVVIVQSGNKHAAFVVSEFLGPQKLVNIPLEGLESHSPCIAGTCVFTGGRLGLTVDIDMLIASVSGDEPGSHSDLPLPMSGEVCPGLNDGPGIISESVAPSGEQPDDIQACQSVSSTASTPEPVGDQFDQGDYDALIEEVKGNLTELQDALISMESSSDDVRLLNNAFRRLHAAKGNFTMMHATDAEKLAHALETLLDFLRYERLTINAELMDLMLDCVSYLNSAAAILPAPSPPPPEDVTERLLKFTSTNKEDEEVMSGDLIGQTFTLSPPVELQILSALKRGEQTFETLIKFTSGRQPDFLNAYLILRRLGLFGNVFSTIPKVKDIEKGSCGSTFKVLWSTALEDDGLEDLISMLSRYYDVSEFQSLPTTVFMYDRKESQPAA